MKLKYFIENKKVEINLEENVEFFSGKNEVLSKKYNDITSNTEWYEKGFFIANFKKIIDFSLMKKELTYSILKNIKLLKPDLSTENFCLENYHKFVDQELHKKVLKKTRRFYFSDLNIQDNKIINHVENIIGCKLGYKRQGVDLDHWIITRINPPRSKGYNPVHKDIYEAFDKNGKFGNVALKTKIPRMVNIWIPICGVNKNTGLPIVPGSHLINENKIIRTKAGVVVEGQQYSVNCIKSWNGNTSMKLISPEPSCGIVFSSHLIHGLAFNNNNDKTRVSLEFRLHLQS